MSLNLPPADTRVFLFHAPQAAADPGSATDRLNEWLGKDRSGGAYKHLRVRDISVTPDHQGGVYFAVTCTLGHVPETIVEAAPETVGVRVDGVSET
jgi:hypothetical protein